MGNERKNRIRNGPNHHSGKVRGNIEVALKNRSPFHNPGCSLAARYKNHSHQTRAPFPQCECAFLDSR